MPEKRSSASQTALTSAATLLVPLPRTEQEIPRFDVESDRQEPGLNLARHRWITPSQGRSYWRRSLIMPQSLWTKLAYLSSVSSRGTVRLSRPSTKRLWRDWRRRGSMAGAILSDHYRRSGGQVGLDIGNGVPRRL